MFCSIRRTCDKPLHKPPSFHHQTSFHKPSHSDRTFPRKAYNGIPEELWLKDYSFNTDTYEEIFTLPNDSAGGEKYYAITIGDVRLVVLFAACPWRSPSLASNIRGKYRESDRDLNNPANWGYGQHILEPIYKVVSNING